MSTLMQIESAVAEFPPHEQWVLLAWLIPVQSFLIDGPQIQPLKATVPLSAVGIDKRFYRIEIISSP